MVSHHLEKASAYINNLLLSRGLIHDGVPIDFISSSVVNGSKSDDETAKIINLVHDLILRRDVRNMASSREFCAPSSK